MVYDIKIYAPIKQVHKIKIITIILKNERKRECKAISFSTIKSS